MTAARARRKGMADDELKPGVWRWRRALGVTRLSNGRTRHLHRGAGKAAGAATRAREWTPEERQARRQRALEQDTARRLDRHRPDPRMRWSM